MSRLRLDKDIFFYQKGEEVWLFPTRTISGIKPVKRDHGTSADYYVEISHPGKVVQIYTKKKNLYALAEAIQAAARQSVA